MISAAAIFWALAGAVAGGVHSLGIRHSVLQTSHALALIGLLRLAVIGLVLTGAAISGFLFPAAAGWLVGFAATLVLFFWRMS
jgi:hypothetical protein